MIGGTIRHRSVLPVLVAACMWMTIPSHAQNRGVYPLGMSAINSGVLPESPFTYSNQFLLYTRDEAKDNQGKPIALRTPEALDKYDEALLKYWNGHWIGR